METLKHSRSYQTAYLNDRSFEPEMVRARQRLILEFLKHWQPKRVLEIGCGPVRLYDQACHRGIPIKKWVIVEPCEAFLRRVHQKGIPLQIFPGFFEKQRVAIRTAVPQGFDLVICSGMLNEVRRPAPFVRMMKTVLAPKGRVHLNVPHAGSLHRRLGVAMNLIPRLAHSSRRNEKFMQYHVFDMPTLQKLVQKNGFVIESDGGYFLKPFSHTQMQSIRKILTPRVLDGLWQLGRQFPELATEIYVNAKLRR